MAKRSNASAGERGRTEPRGAVAYALMREAIRTGTFKRGQRIREVEVAAKLKMSRTPIREALRRLEAEGLIAHEPRRGLVISSLDSQKITELYVMRETLECTAARLAARHASDAEIAVLEEMVREERQIGDDRAAHVEHNRRFHAALCRSAHNRYLLQSLNALDNALILIEQSTYRSPETRKHSHTAHRTIVDAVAARDPSAAEEATRAHTRAAFRNRLKSMIEEDENPDLEGFPAEVGGTLSRLLAH